MTTTPATHGVEDVAAMLGKSPDWVKRRCATGEFPHLRVGRSIRFTAAHLDQILGLLEQQPGHDFAGVGLARRSRVHHRRRLRST